MKAFFGGSFKKDISQNIKLTMAGFNSLLCIFLHFLKYLQWTSIFFAIRKGTIKIIQMRSLFVLRELFGIMRDRDDMNVCGAKSLGYFSKNDF